MEFISLVFYAVIAIVSAAVYYFKTQYEYWKKKGIPHVEPRIPYGIWTDVGKTTAVYEIFSNVYRKYKGTGPFVGFSMFAIPSVVLLDLDLIKNVLIKDFNHFQNRGSYHNERDDPLTAHLVSVDGPKWRTLRTKLTPTFTTGKMKFIFSTVLSVGKYLVQTFEKEIKIKSNIEMKDMMARFTTDVIGTCAFGIECNSLNDPDVEFRTMNTKVLEKFHSKNFRLLTIMFPALARFFHVKEKPDEAIEFYTKITRDTVEYREKNNIRRNDFMDLLIDLKKKNSVASGNGKELSGFTMTDIVAQLYMFFVAGYDLSSTTMGFALYELARNQDVQDKLRQEVNGIMAKHNNELTYDGIKEMHYLDQIISETLRMYPPVLHIRRTANAAYPTSDPRYTIPKGAHVMIPAFGIQRDPEIYPNPDVFDPDRFSPEETKKRHPMTWLPFGDGPRNCIGLPFGKLQVNIGLCMLIRNFKFSVTTDTPIPMKFDRHRTFLTSEKGINLRVDRI